MPRVVLRASLVPVERRNRDVGGGGQTDVHKWLTWSCLESSSFAAILSDDKVHYYLRDRDLLMPSAFRRLSGGHEEGPGRSALQH